MVHPRNIFAAICTLSIILTLILTGCSGSDRSDHSENQQQAEQERQLEYVAEITFLNSENEEVSAIRAAVADDNESRSQGLMNVTDLPEDSGMLFIFDENQPRSFWMASTPLSLDIIFINDEFDIVRIHRNTTPFSQENIPSDAPAKYVVEVNAGYTIRHDINEGGRIRIEE
ncbi:MAG: DUF192 domain-containing protein [Bacteroidetes bacterium]|jgi:uncharacterized membrane protein (UPF0127 family)|nr:DUF192 domain-containing protein [Bacteroidota bacterium]